jgi:hypothetical protein
MNTYKLGSKWVVSLFSGLTALTLAAGFAFGPAVTAFADDGTPPAPPQANGEKAGGRIDARLARAYARTQELFGMQGERLSGAGERADKIQSLIDTAKANGQDTSAVEAALASFKTSVATAQAAHDTAANLLSTHAGFDDKGKVTDREQARQTLQSVREAMRQAHDALDAGRQTLRQALQAWREAHPRPTAPSPTSPTGL